jgi:predicted MPP superfamily phosphohydrolase
LVGAAITGYCAAEAHWYGLRHYQIPALPTGSSPIKVLHISDTHFTRQQRRKVAWVAELASLEPDMVAITGDMYAFADAMETALEALEPLLAYPGAFVLGSNDYYSAAFKNPGRYLWHHGKPLEQRSPDLPARQFCEVLTKAGWFDLNNQRAGLILGPDQLETDLVGLADPHIGLDKMPAPLPQGHSAPLVLGLVHAPYQAAVQQLVDDSARVVFAGHTHGGQITLPGVGAIITNTDLPRRFAVGVHRWPASSGYLTVSEGLGTSPYAPFRLGRRPAASLVTLTGHPETVRLFVGGVALAVTHASPARRTGSCTHQIGPGTLNGSNGRA